MKTAIVTDTNSGVFPQEGKQLDVFVLPMPIMIDARTYHEGEDLTSNQFYQFLLEGRSAYTAQPGPGILMDLWDHVLEEYDDLVYIPMSGGLSSSVQNAQALAEEYQGRVQVVDNHRISMTQKGSVLDAKAMADAGCSAAEIKKELERIAYDAMIYISVETLEYLKRGGRITPAGAALSTVLNIKPLLKIEGERLDAYARVRGTANCRKRLIEAIRLSAETFEGRNWKFDVGEADSFLNLQERQQWLSTARELLPGHTINGSSLTCSIGCHVGPNAFGMAVYRRLT